LDYADFPLEKRLFQKPLLFQTLSKEPSLCSITVSIQSLFNFVCLVAEKSLKSLINAHESELGALSVNPDGTLIASASQKGTVIKIFSADGGETLQ